MAEAPLLSLWLWLWPAPEPRRVPAWAAQDWDVIQEVTSVSSSFYESADDLSGVSAKKPRRKWHLLLQLWHLGLEGKSPLKHGSSPLEEVGNIHPSMDIYWTMACVPGYKRPHPQGTGVWKDDG